MSCRCGKARAQPDSVDCGRLATNTDWTLDKLIGACGGSLDPVCFYVVKSVIENAGGLEQDGSGPNVDGGCVTLCTCKHAMRASKSINWRPGVWLAGFTSRDARTTTRRHNLFYLTQVARVFNSHRDLWNDAHIPDSAKEIKAADRSQRGDLFRPKHPAVAPYEPQSYERPIAGHSHEKNAQWHKDIGYHGRSGNPAVLLVGDPKHTFLWRKPLIYIPNAAMGTSPRGHRRRASLTCFLSLLRS